MKTKKNSYLRNFCVVALVSLLAQCVWAAEARVISINFNPSVSNHTKPVANDSTEVGLVAVPGSTWNDIGDTSLTSISKEMKIANGEDTAMTMSLSCRGSWHVDGATEAYRQHYLDIGTNNQVVNITLGDIPFDNYDVVLYSPYSSDQNPSTMYRPWKVNNVWWTTRDMVSGVAVPVAEADASTSYWGGGVAAATWGYNAMRVCNQSGQLTIVGLNNNSNHRAGPLAAIQIVEVVDPVVTIDGNTTISAINTEAGESSRVIVKLSDGATVNFDAEPAANVEFVSTGSITLTASAQPSAESLAKIDISRVAGAVKRSWENLGSFAVNFHSSAGANKDQALAQSDWFDLSEKAGTHTISTDGLTKVWWSAGGVWDDGQSGNTFVRGYLDDSDSNGVRVTITGVPYDEYDVIIYSTTDTDNSKLSHKNVNGLDYTYDSTDAQVAKKGTANYGSADSSSTIAYGSNAIRVRGQTASTFSLIAGKTTNSTGERDCVSAIQIVPRVIATAAAKIGTTNYDTVADAIANAGATDEIEILKDSSENLTLDRNVIFSVAQGESFTLSGTLGSNYNVTKKGAGTLAIKHNVDSGKIVDVVEGTLKLTTANNYSMKGQLIVRAGAELVNMSTDAFGIDSDNVRADIYGTLNMNGTRWTLGRNNHTNDIYFYPGSTVKGTGQSTNGAFDNGQADQTNLHFVKNNGVGGEVTFNTEIRFRSDNGNNAGMEIEEGMTVNYVNTVGFRSGEGTLNLSGQGTFNFGSGSSCSNLATLNIGKDIKVGGSLATAVSNDGSGTILVTSLAENTPRFTFAETWTGTVEISALSQGSTRTQLMGWGTENSKIVYKGLSGSAIWVGSNPMSPTLQIDGAVEINNGGSGANYVLNKITGSGDLTLASWSGCGKAGYALTYTLNTLEDYTGTLTAKNQSNQSNGAFKLAIGNIVRTTAPSYGDKVLSLTRTCAGSNKQLDYDVTGTKLNGESAALVLKDDGIYLGEAMIGTTAYLTVADAIENLGDGETITLLNPNATLPAGWAKVTKDGVVTLRQAGEIYWKSGDWQANTIYYATSAKDSTTTYLTGDTVVFDTDTTVYYMQSWSEVVNAKISDNTTVIFGHNDWNGAETRNIMSGSTITVGTGARALFGFWDNKSEKGAPKIVDLTINGEGTWGQANNIKDGVRANPKALEISGGVKGTAKLVINEGDEVKVLSTGSVANDVVSGVTTKRVVYNGGVYSLETIQPEPPTPTEDGITPSIPGAQTIKIVDAEGTTVEGGSIPLVTGVYTVTGKVGETVVATETLAVVKTKDAESGSSPDPVTTAVAVPFKGATVANLLNTALLNEGDVLKALNSAQEYYAWTLDANKKWQPISVTRESGTEQSPTADETELKRGAAVWVTTAGKVVAFGAYEDTAVEPEVVKGYNLIGNPKMTAITPEAKTVGDVLIPVGSTELVRYKVIEKAGGTKVWQCTKSVPVSIPGLSVDGSEEDISEEDPTVQVGGSVWLIK